MRVMLNQIRKQRIIKSTLLCTYIIGSLFLFPKNGYAQPAVLESGMSPNQSTWIFETPLENVNRQVKFFMRVQPQGNLSSYGTFDYYFKVQVLRPDGTDVWNNRYGLQALSLPHTRTVTTIPYIFLGTF